MERDDAEFDLLNQCGGGKKPTPTGYVHNTPGCTHNYKKQHLAKDIHPSCLGNIFTTGVGVGGAA